MDKKIISDEIYIASLNDYSYITEPALDQLNNKPMTPGSRKANTGTLDISAQE